MKQLGIISYPSRQKEILSIFLKKPSYSLISIKEKQQLKDVDGVIIYVNEQFCLVEAIEWLLELKQRPTLFIWIYCEEINLKAQEELLFQLGVNDVVCCSENIDKLLYVIQNTFSRIEFKESTIKKIGEVVFNDKNLSVCINDKNLILTNTEYQLVKLLLNKVDNIISLQEISYYLWGEEKENQKYIIDTLLLRLRENRKIDQILELKTVVSTGYSVKLKRDS